jgi:ATP-dependent helicase/nuclease subunit A
VERLIRLMLNGAEPSSILCLTFTKAAAAEMAGRVFKALAGWATLSDAELRDELRKIGESSDVSLTAARRLFTKALETPGGLKIQTIHAFCERLLQLFPVEAGVPPGFEVIGERQKSELLAIAKSRVLSEAHDPALAAALDRVSRFVQAEDFDKLLEQALRLGGNPDGVARDLRRHLGVAEGETVESIATALTLRATPRVVDALEQSFQKKQSGPIRRGDWLNALFTKEGEPRKPSEKILDKNPWLRHASRRPMPS